MIVLDTNVLSEVMRPAPDQRVLAWFRRRPASGMFTTTITQAEILYGLALLPAGRRRDQLHQAVEGIFREDLAGRVLSFDGAAARAYAAIASSRRAAGRPISQMDAQIAAIAASREASVATRNVADFDGCGVAVINPWSDD